MYLIKNHSNKRDYRSPWCFLGYNLTVTRSSLVIFKYQGNMQNALTYISININLLIEFYLYFFNCLASSRILFQCPANYRIVKSHSFHPLLQYKHSTRKSTCLRVLLQQDISCLYCKNGMNEWIDMILSLITPLLLNLCE